MNENECIVTVEITVDARNSREATKQIVDGLVGKFIDFRILEVQGGTL